ncbi:MULTISPECIES: helix-turn-helix domain-containing protein [unclassified Acidovorax]|uniref:helix-turn-helix domain-containing protein n=1 Tax=unclassified Acidovorax TaxID=2684926 RepID=UPI000C1A456F|nr:MULTISPECIES: helix-turn-helix transcriptional regulator [unclassified Acidovorax]PIF19083.1 helix-turn-helix protein [Acidovorax sp. 59]PKW01889.1 helix-turn-helix protein [Acidovorax sp. 30]
MTSAPSTPSRRTPRHPLPHRSAAAGPASFGDHLRTWRQQRHLSQLELADEADISTRHVSFMETGRTNPSRDMVLRLCERLAIPLRERNALLVAAGYAPMYRERALDDPALTAARQAVELVLKGHEPCPAIALDRCWNVVAANRAAQALLAAHMSPELLAPPINVFRLSLHPNGLASRIANLAQWRHHLFERLRQQIHATGDPALLALQAELLEYPAPDESTPLVMAGEMLGVVMPFCFNSMHGMLSLISTTTIFGTPVDVTLQELAVESFFPADAFTAQVLREMAQQYAAD